MSLRHLSSCLLVSVLLITELAHAQPSPSVAASSPASAASGAFMGSAVSRVEITGGRLDDLNERRSETVSKTTIGRAEIEKSGATSVAEILSQQPGITYSGVPGQKGGELRMRGMGAGYTQILVNGDPVPPGFTIDSLAPGIVERIEVYRLPVAEFSAQSIAGTINFVLREKKKGDANHVGITASVPDNRHVQGRYETQVGNVFGKFSLASGVVVEPYREIDSQYVSRTQIRDSSKSLVSDQADTSLSQSHGYDVTLTPTMKWSDETGDKIGLDLYLLDTNEHRVGLYDINQSVGAPPYLRDESSADSTFDVRRATLAGTLAGSPESGRKLDLKLALNSARWIKSEIHDQTGGTDESLFDSRVDALNRGVKASAKFHADVSSVSEFSAGIDWDSNRRIEDWRQSLNGTPYGFDFGTHLSSALVQSSAFAQMDWKESKSFAAYGGMRIESLRTESTDIDESINHVFTILSPILQGSWHIDGEDKNQVRLGLSRGYRAPRVTDLLKRTVLSYHNSEFSPDVAGNSDLGPERAWSLDLTYEHYLEKHGIISATVFAKRISNTILSATTLVNGRWVNSEFNQGLTTSLGLEFEAKTNLQYFFPGAPPVDLRATFTRSWSDVHAVPGSNNHIPGQVPTTMGLGADYRLSPRWSFGGKAAWSSGYDVRSSGDIVNNFGRQMVGDLYVRLDVDRSTQFRLGANNILAQDKVTGLHSESAQGTQDTRQAATTWVTWTLALKKEF
jgi:outer membrane receptor for ferrienterochelin and colicins